MILRQPLAQARRQQQLLITVTGEKVEGHRSLLPAEEQVTSSSDPDRTDPRGSDRFMRQPQMRGLIAGAGFEPATSGL